MNRINRRRFLKTASAAAGALAYPYATMARSSSASVRIGAATYTPRDFPIQAKRPWEVALTDEFWKPKIATNARVTIPFEIDKLLETERGVSGNVLEAAMIASRSHPDAKLQAQVDTAVRATAARRASGNSGFEAAATLYFTTGRRELIDRSVDAADALYRDFVANDPPFSGGERDAINCLQLYRVTHDKKHLDLAKHYLDIRGLENAVNRSRHNQSHKPVVEQSEAVGHAVNCASLMVSLVDVGVLTGLHEYFEAAERMWSDAVTRKMYITGGIGSTGNEGFGEPYSLPNISAYAETCAVLMFMTLNHRMFLATGDGRYIDVMERGMYNNAIDGVSASGDRFFYVNRLASAGDGRDLRWARASLECCPPNLVRFLASMPGLIYAQADAAIYVNLYVSSEAAFDVGGARVTLTVASEMPWSGKSTISISTGDAVRTAIKLRIPGWARNQPAPGSLYAYTPAENRAAVVSVNGAPVSSGPDAHGYVTIEREWKNGDAIIVDLPTKVRTVVADARVREDRRRVAFERGPIVYCAEWPEAEQGHALDLLVDPSSTTASFDRSLFGGTNVLRTHARRVSRPASPSKALTLLPYHLWANRGAGEMSVWLSTAEYELGDTGPAGGCIFYINPNHAADGWRYLEAAPEDQSGGAPWGCFRRAIEGARGTAVGTGRQNTADMLSACADPLTAASLCASYRLNGVNGWFLPSRDELAALYRNLKTAGVTMVRDAGLADNFSYWSSSQQTADMAAHIDFADNGRQHSDDKDFPRRVRAIRAF